MILRRACPDDAPQLVALVQQTYTNPPYNHYLDTSSWIRFMHDHVSLVMEDNGRVVAHAGLEDRITMGILSRTVVHENYRGHGLYKTLYDARLAQAQSRNLGYVESHATTHHPIVQHFLLSKGFEPVGVELFEINDVAGVGQRSSLVRLRKSLTDPRVMPIRTAPPFPGLVPIDYHLQQATWKYEEIPKGFDPSLIHIDPLVVEKLHLQKLMRM